MNKMKIKYTGLLVVLMAGLLGSCKQSEDVFDDPYAGGTPPLGIVIDKQQVPSPASGNAGTEVTIKAKGLMPYKDKLKFLFNGQEAQVVSVTDAEVKVKVPGRASSGITSVVVDGQLVFGPDFTVLGKVNKDLTYVVVNGTNGPINKAVTVASGNTVLLGDFSNFDNKGVVRPIYRIVRTLPNGTYDRSLQSGAGANGALYDMAILNNQWYIAGRFSGYAQRDGLSNVTKLSSSGQIDTVSVPTYEGKTKFVSTFNGGTNGGIQNIYARGNKLVISGDFTYYLSRRYDQPNHKYKDSTIIDSTDVRQLARLNTNGTLDSNWRFDKTASGYRGRPGKSLPGGNGPIETLMHSDGKLLVWGNFTTFDNTNVGRIIRLNENGTIDPTFNAGGAGADDYIYQISYDATVNKYLAVGRFKTYNGTAVSNMVMLNYDGSIDQSFKALAFEGGYPTYCKLLKDGLGVVSGDFKTYDGAARNGFLITDLAGGLADGYNTVGNLAGSIYDVMETTSAEGKRALLIMGSFYLFDNKENHNIVRVTLD
ncbi:DUF5008 domain-containing protein [Pedobacter sp. JY14-1]|uniref:DUF5008 domain-containing protein n=1 Tax=Pedobacter sp. JY14-1 TaxID=3034151 RepID=UPI0023E2CA40|nr:DUF5008 domain-containing protein [Pedobacter sp. JY14-1]